MEKSEEVKNRFSNEFEKKTGYRLRWGEGKGGKKSVDGARVAAECDNVAGGAQK